jgi:hypothetical protein
LARIHLDKNQLVGLWVIFDAQHFSDHDVGEPFRATVDRLNLDAYRRETVSKVVDIFREIDKVPQP